MKRDDQVKEGIEVNGGKVDEQSGGKLTQPFRDILQCSDSSIIFISSIQRGIKQQESI